MKRILLALALALPTTALAFDFPIGDTGSIDLGSNAAGELTADVIIDPAAGNGASVGPDGLFVAGDGTGTDDQELSLTGNTLALEDGGSVDLSAFQSMITTAPNATNGTDIFLNGTLVGTIPDLNTTYSHVENADGDLEIQAIDEQGNPLGPLGLYPDADTMYQFSENADGNLVIQAVDKDGNPLGGAFIYTEEDTQYQFATNADGDLTVQAVDILGNPIGALFVYSIDTAVNFACDITAPTGYTEDDWVSNFINQGIQFDSAAIPAYTTPCNRMVYAATNSSVSQANSTVTGVDNVNDGLNTQMSGTNNNANAGTVGGDITGNDIVAIDTTNLHASGREHIVTGGTDNNVLGQRHVLTDMSRSLFGGAQNSGTGTRNSLVVGALNVVDQTLGSIVSGIRHIVTNSNQVLVIGSTNTVNGSIGSFIMARSSEMNDLLSTLVIGRGVYTDNVNTDHGSIVGGFDAPATVPLSSNRRYYLNGVTGDLQISGGFTAGFVFPGFGEYALGEIAEGQAVVFEGVAGVRLAREGERPDGVTRTRLAMSAGGGIDPENSPFMLDEMGNRLMAEINAGTEEAPVMVMAPVKNPDYDQERANKTVRTGVEMLGRAWVALSGEVAVGNYVGAGGVRVEPSMGFRVLALNEDAGTALVLVK